MEVEEGQVQSAQAEEELVRSAQAGDEEAFYMLMSSQKERLYRIAYAYLRNEGDAIEAIQETTCRAWLKLGGLRQPAWFGTWIVRILLNCCHDERKRKQRFPAAEEPEAAARADEAPEGRWALRLQVSEALERLEPKYRQMIILKYFEDMTLTDIAKTLGRPLGTVKTRLHQALRRLAPLMSEEGDER